MVGFDLEIKKALVFGLLWFILSVAIGAVIGMIPGLSSTMMSMGQLGQLIYAYIGIVAVWIVWLGFDVPKMVAKHV